MSRSRHICKLGGGRNRQQWPGGTCECRPEGERVRTGTACSVDICTQQRTLGNGEDTFWRDRSPNIGRSLAWLGSWGWSSVTPLTHAGLEDLWPAWGSHWPGLGVLAALQSKLSITVLLLPFLQGCPLRSGLPALPCHLLFLLSFPDPSTPSLTTPHGLLS